MSRNGNYILVPANRKTDRKADGRTDRQQGRQMDIDTVLSTDALARIHTKTKTHTHTCIGSWIHAGN